MILRSLDPHVRRLVLTGAAALLAYIALSLTESVNASYTVTNASGLGLLVAELFWLSAAALGACMATLAAVVRGIERGRGPGHELRNWMGILFGVMAGFILVTLVPTDPLEAALHVGPTALAVVGAFLASSIYRIVTGVRTPTPEGGSGSATAEP